ncbi:hypothetical protein [Nocardia panacis]|nr:hypothetical protein [Nocardia panacis]
MSVVTVAVLVGFVACALIIRVLGARISHRPPRPALARQETRARRAMMDE